MTTFLLIRHATTDVIGHRITGRLPGVALSTVGVAEAEALAASLSGLSLDAVCSSPLERARDTAAALARPRKLPVEIVDDLLEVNYGEWSGRTLEELAADPHWRTYNTYRSATRIPGGETALELQARSVTAIEMLRAKHGEATLAVVTHSDVIKAVLAFYLGMSLDLASRLTIDPASVSTLVLEDWGPQILCINRPPLSTLRQPGTEEPR